MVWKYNGNFLKAIAMIGKFDDMMADHLKRVQESITLKTHMPNYLENRYQHGVI